MLAGMLRTLRTAIPALAALCGALGLFGCGSGPGNSSNPAPVHAVSNLAGNWSLVGSIPQGFPFLTPGPTLSVTFSVVDHVITGSGAVTVFCTSGNTGSGFGESFVVSGTVAEDGSFTAQTPSPPSGLSSLPITISGSVPAAPGAPWSGQYTLDASSAGTCHPVLSGNFEATGIATVAGTYAGTGTLGEASFLSPTAQGRPVSISVALTQGTSVQDESAMNGTVAITGVPCFRGGTLMTPPITTPPRAGAVAGDQVQASFRMDDGSQLVLVGYLSDTAASVLKIQSAVIFSGACASAENQSLHFTTLTRQG